MLKYIVTSKPKEAGLYNNNAIQDYLGNEWFDFPEIGTVCTTTQDGFSIMFGRYTICDIGSPMALACFKKVEE